MIETAQIFNLIKTSDNLTTFKNVLTSLELAGKIGFKKVSMPPEFYDIFSQINDTNFDQLVRELWDVLDLLVKVDIVLPFNPDQSFLDVLYERIKSCFGTNHFVAVSVDTSLIGGSIVTVSGKYYDNSTKRKIDEYFKGYDLGLFGI